MAFEQFPRMMSLCIISKWMNDQNSVLIIIIIIYVIIIYVALWRYNGILIISIYQKNILRAVAINKEAVAG